MAGGTIVHRNLIFVLPDGRIILDWGDQMGVDLTLGEFVTCNLMGLTYPVTDNDLETLKRMGRVSSFDDKNVVVVSLPDPRLH